ncbi:MAG TPA: hypothetical protein VFM18_22355 [Methanosarcina sp.]|nr:hypothetical protein [Methanosarcina sp.]
MNGQIIKDGLKYFVYYGGNLIAECTNYMTANRKLYKALKEEK